MLCCTHYILLASYYIYLYMFRRWMFYRFGPFSKPIRFYFQDAINVSEKTKSLNKGRGYPKTG
jgi:hypothetical protein